MDGGKAGHPWDDGRQVAPTAVAARAVRRELKDCIVKYDKIVDEMLESEYVECSRLPHV